MEEEEKRVGLDIARRMRGRTPSLTSPRIYVLTATAAAVGGWVDGVIMYYITHYIIKYTTVGYNAQPQTKRKEGRKGARRMKLFISCAKSNGKSSTHWTWYRTVVDRLDERRRRRRCVHCLSV